MVTLRERVETNRQERMERLARREERVSAEMDRTPEGSVVPGSWTDAPYRKKYWEEALLAIFCWGE